MILKITHRHQKWRDSICHESLLMSINYVAILHRLRDIAAAQIEYTRLRDLKEMLNFRQDG